MRFSICTFALALFVPTLLAAPTTIKRTLQARDQLSSAEITTSTLGSQISAFIARIEADPLLELSPYGDSKKSGTYNIPKQLESAFATAVAAIEALPSLTSSSDPSATLVEDFGPLITVVTHGFFFSLIDLKLLVIDTAGEDVPGLSDFLNDLDAGSYAYTLALNKEFEGIATQIATAIGANSALGQAIETLGGNTFTLLFDHI